MSRRYPMRHSHRRHSPYDTPQFPGMTSDQDLETTREVPDVDPDPDTDPTCEVVGCHALAPLTARSADYGTTFHYCTECATEKLAEHADLEIIVE